MNLQYMNYMTGIYLRIFLIYESFESIVKFVDICKSHIIKIVDEFK